jgi:photosystem II stability/assembly factor-like uncharacterized protein
MGIIWRLGLAALALSAVAVLAGCGDGTDEGDKHVALGHVHGLGLNPADGTLYAASHHGLFRVSGNAAPEQIAGRTQDFMGFTIVGPDHFLASGHPGSNDSGQPPHLGLIETTDGGQTWTSVSLSGEADFHAMEAKHHTVYAYDSQSGQLMTSTDRHNWDRVATSGIADIAVAPDAPDEIIATTRDGPSRSADRGRTFTILAGAPLLSLVDWPDADHLLGVGPDGAVYISGDRGANWTRQGQVAGNPQAITAGGETDIYIATEDAINRSSDGGATFSVFERF